MITKRREYGTRLEKYMADKLTGVEIVFLATDMAKDKVITTFAASRQLARGFRAPGSPGSQ